MPKRIAVHTIILHREGKRVKVSPGKPFDFTPAELADIKKNSPDSIRVPVNEASPATEEKNASEFGNHLANLAAEAQAKADAHADELEVARKAGEAEEAAAARQAELDAAAKAFEAEAAEKAQAEKPANNGKQGGKNGGKNAPDTEL